METTIEGAWPGLSTVANGSTQENREVIPETLAPPAHSDIGIPAGDGARNADLEHGRRRHLRA